MREDSGTMRKPFAYLAFGVIAAAGGILAAWFVASSHPDVSSEEILAAYREGEQYGGLTISYPLNGTLFPPEIVPPTFRWTDQNGASDRWLVTIAFRDGSPRSSFLTRTTQWTPSEEQWEAIKRRSLDDEATAAILGVNSAGPREILSGASITFSTSSDEVGAPLFYREVHLPFIEAVADPATHIRWRFGTIDSRQTPPVVLEKLPNCANCHSFTADGSTLAMEVDSANDKGSYVIAPVAEEMVFDEPPRARALPRAEALPASIGSRAGFIDSGIANRTVGDAFCRESGLPLVALVPLAMQDSIGRGTPK